MRPNILVVDDELGVRESLRMILSDNYNVLLAENGRECLNIVKNTEQLDLVILDIKMPDINGIDVLKQIKEINPFLPVIIITGVGTHDVAIDSLKYGALDLIVKPVSVYTITDTVKWALAQNTNKFKKKKTTFPSIEEILYEEYFSTLMMLSKIIEAKDSYTERHSERVTKYAVALAKAIGLPNEKIEVIRQSSLIHDIGKVGISDLILAKSGTLTPQERTIIEKHPVIGSEILKPLKLFRIELSIVRHHHERYDGKGYPDKLKEKEIPLYARIVAISDAYDAMTTDRPYRNALSYDEVINEFKKHRGTQFDPELTDVFIELINKDLFPNNI